MCVLINIAMTRQGWHTLPLSESSCSCFTLPRSCHLPRKAFQKTMAWSRVGWGGGGGKVAIQPKKADFLSPHRFLLLPWREDSVIHAAMGLPPNSPALCSFTSSGWQERTLHTDVAALSTTWEGRWHPEQFVRLGSDVCHWNIAQHFDG